jgi:hypothetical protein
MTTIKRFNLFNENSISDKYITIFTKTDINDIENKINNILDKFSDKCKYYINISDEQPYYYVSFNDNNIEIINKFSFEIYIYKNIDETEIPMKDNKAIVVLSDGINSHPKWENLKKNLKILNL